MRRLSKSKLLAYRQCPRRLWLEIHRPDLNITDAETEAGFKAGHHVGDIARGLYDPNGKGVLIDIELEGFDQAAARTQALLTSKQPIFEGTFITPEALALSDVLLPVRQGWRMVEVKSSTSVKDYHRDDVAIQSLVARDAGLSLKSVSLAYIDNTWTYPGNEDYQGLLVEENLSDQAFSRETEVRQWIADARQTMAGGEPEVKTGPQCANPFACGFYAHCAASEPQAEHPIGWLPSFRKTEDLREQGILDMKDLPDAVSLTEKQQRVRNVTLTGQPWFDANGAADDLKPHSLPSYFLDFETIQFAVPIWKGTRPYQQIPFQFSVHRVGVLGKLQHEAFLELSGNDPSRAFAEKLIISCGDNEPVFVYNAAFERTRIAELAERFPKLAKRLLNINERIVDLLPVARERYYHPSQKGSWSIKAVLPALVPELSYGNLEGVQDGGGAQAAYLEAIHPQTGANRKQTLEHQLLEYCKLDTYAMVRLWQVFAGKTHWRL